MSKKKNKKYGYGGGNDTLKAKPLIKVTQALNKKGKIKGHNKKETKILKAMCPHHRINKKGQSVPKLYNNGDYCICPMCKGFFKPDFFEKEFVKNTVSDMTEITNQAKFMAVATGAGSKAVEKFCTVSVDLVGYTKAYEKLKAVAQKQGNIKNKKKKHVNRGSEAYGSWGTK